MVTTAVFFIEVHRLFLVPVFIPSKEDRITIDREATEFPFFFFRFWELTFVDRLASLIAICQERYLCIVCGQESVIWSSRYITEFISLETSTVFCDDVVSLAHIVYHHEFLCWHLEI